MTEEIMTIEECAKYLKNLKTGELIIYRLAQEGKIPATKVGNMWRFRKEKIDEWLDRSGKSSLRKKKKDERSNRNTR